MEKEIKEIENLQVLEEEKGANLVEYALLAALIAVVCIAAITFLGTQASTTFRNVGSHLGASATGLAVN